MAKKLYLLRKIVVFNLLDPYQSKLMEHIEKQSNFSAYIKRLIQRDMEGGTVPAPAKEPPAAGGYNHDQFL